MSDALQELLTRGVAEIYPTKEHLEKELKSGRKLRLYFGIDPTSPSLHIGHAIGLRKMRQFQELGHEVILLIGSFTAMIGDPTDKSAARVQLSQTEVLKNAAGYKKQIGSVLPLKGKNAAKLMFNHKWLSKLSFQDVLELASNFTVQQMVERDMFEKRLKDGKPIYVHEFMYPLMQGYDSIAMDVDLEIGGSDQMFNMLAGRTLMKKMKDKEKFVMTFKLLENDEGKKMSKSEGGFIALTDSPEDMYGKIMSMDDSMMLSYFELATDVSMDDIEGMKIQMKKGINPRDIKARLAHAVVSLYIGEKQADKAQDHFDSVFRNQELPKDIKEMKVSKKTDLVTLLVESELVSSKSEARRLLSQGAIKIDKVQVKDADMEIKGTGEGVVLQRGKRQFVKLVK